jgi:hypothetical protein
MAMIGDRVLDNGLGVFNAEGEQLDICSQEPATFAEAQTTYSLGQKVGPTISNPADRGAGGREVTVSAITDGVVDGTGDASHWAVTDTTNSRLLSAGPLAGSEGVTDGNTFTLTEFKIGIPDPA